MKCPATITLGDMIIKCGLDSPHQDGTMPDIHAAQLTWTDDDGSERPALLEWPLRHIYLEQNPQTFDHVHTNA